jgi:hypothetical protein
MNRTRTALRGLAAAALLLGGAAAQNDFAAQAELQHAQREMQQNRAEIDRLIEMRLRHDLGLAPVGQADGADRTFRPPAPVTTEAMEHMQQELREEDAATASLQERYAKLATAATQLRTDAGARVRIESAIPPNVMVPSAGRPLPVAHAPAPRRDHEVAAQYGTAAGTAAAPGAAPVAETAPRRATADPVAVETALDPMLAQIHGSTDHQRVAMALFRAGQALTDRAETAREQGQDAAAKEIDARGKERLRRALDELQPLLAEKPPPLDALFCQGKTLELLFRHAERNENLGAATSARDWQRREQEVRDAFLKITVRDIKKSGARGEVEVLGQWGQAAQAALEHFRWMNLHASYDATAAIQALTWPGEKAQ